MADADAVQDDIPYQSLYRRFRPSTFAEVRGQDHVVLALRNAVRDGRVAHAYLFSGPRGTGKTSTARILAKALNCTDLRDGEPCGVCSSCVEIAKGTSLDVHELDAASNNGVEAMRDLVSRAALGTPGRQKVYIVDEVHMLSTAASNALLKTLEEPPAHVVFVLATTDPQKVLPTIRSRTQHFEFRLLGAETLGDLLEQVRRDAHLDVPDEALDIALRRGRGSARDALSILDQVAASEVVDDDLPELDEILESLIERDAGRALVAVAKLSSTGFGPQQLAADLVDLLRQGFLAMVAPDLMAVSGAERDTIAGSARQLGLAALVRAMEVLGRTQVEMRDAPDPRVNLELSLVRLAHPEVDESAEALLARIERLEQGGVTAPASAGSVGPSTVPQRPGAGGPAPAGPAPAPVEAAPPLPTSPRELASSPGLNPSGSTSPGSEPALTASDEGAAGAGVPGTPGPPAPSAGPLSTATGPAAIRKTLGAVRRESQAATTAPPAPVPSAPASAEPSAAAESPREPRPPVSEPDRLGADVPVPASAGTADGPAFPSRDQLVQAWGDQVLGSLRPKAKALYQAGRFMAVDGERAVFGLPNDIHRKRCEELRGDIEQALSDHFGRPVALALVVDDGTSAPPPPASPSLPPEDAPTDTGSTGDLSGGTGPGPVGPTDRSGAEGPASASGASPEASGSPGADDPTAGEGAEPSVGSVDGPGAARAGVVQTAGHQGSDGPSAARAAVARGAEAARTALRSSATRAAPSSSEAPLGDEPPEDDMEDFSVFDESDLGEVISVDNSVTARVLRAFPGAEEVS